MNTRNLISILLVLCTFASFGQDNETKTVYYDWSGKSTKFQQGYIILASGDKVDGLISLKGIPLEEVHYKKDEEAKKMKFNLSSIKAYGLVVNKPVCTSDEELFEWKYGATATSGKTIPRKGHVIMLDGTRKVGMIQAKKQSGEWIAIEVATPAATEKISHQLVKSFGIQVTIAQITKNGEKISKHEGENFYEGVINLEDGSTKSGWMGFLNSDLLDQNRPGLGRYYSKLLFSETKKGDLEVVNNISSLERTEQGKKRLMVGYESGFSYADALDDLQFKDPMKNLSAGVITLKDGTTEKGKIAQRKNMTWYGIKIIFQAEDHTIKTYLPGEVTTFTQNIEGKDVKYVAEKSAFVEELFGGETFQLIRNPFPTTTSGLMTGLAKTATGVASDVAVNEMTGNDEAAKNLSQASDKELEAAQEQAQSIASNTDGNLQKSANKANMAIETEQASREISENLVVTKKEWLLVNLKTGERDVLLKDKFKKNIEDRLMGCGSFIMLDKKEKKVYLEFENAVKTAEMLDKCYSK